MADCYLSVPTSGRGLLEVEAVEVGGPTNAGKIAALNSTGRWDVSMMPVDIQPNTDTTGICGTTSLTAGMFVNFYDAAGIKSVRPADATDNTKPAHGFVLTGYTVGQSVTVYLPGSKNTQIPLGSFVAADVSKVLYLSTSGGVTLTRPTTVGACEQSLGHIVNVGSVVTVAFNPSTIITLG